MLFTLIWLRLNMILGRDKQQIYICYTFYVPLRIWKRAEIQVNQENSAWYT